MERLTFNIELRRMNALPRILMLVARLGGAVRSVHAESHMMDLSVDAPIESAHRFGPQPGSASQARRSNRPIRRNRRMITLYDTTLRDGSQGEGTNFTVRDKLRITQLLDEFGLPMIEGGWPGSNPKDVEYFSFVFL